MTVGKPPKLRLVKPSGPRRPTFEEEIRELARKYRFAGIRSTPPKKGDTHPHAANLRVVLEALGGEDTKLVAELARQVRDARDTADRRADLDFRREWLARLDRWDGTKADDLAAELVEAVVYRGRLERWLQIARYQVDVDGLAKHLSATLQRAFERPRKARKDAMAIPGAASLRAALGALGLTAKQIDTMLDFKRKG